MATPIEDERARRFAIWHELKRRGGPNDVSPSVVKELRIHVGEQGIFRDHSLTARITGSSAGFTVGILHTGSAYADDIFEEGIVYHYPATKRATSRDTNEVQATLACGEHTVPLFVVIKPALSSTVRNVRLGWVVENDAPSRQMLIRFSEAVVPFQQGSAFEGTTFMLQTERKHGATQVKTRPNQWRFRFDVLKRYGQKCAVCSVTEPRLLEAAHLCSVENNGSDDPRNGLVFCRNHHAAFDAGLFRIHPDTGEVAQGNPPVEFSAIGVQVKSIAHLPNAPHPDALRIVWDAHGCTTNAG